MKKLDEQNNLLSTDVNIFWKLKIDEVLDKLNSSRNGLENEEAQKRLQLYGFNEICQRPYFRLDYFLHEFKNPFIWLLILAFIISVVVRQKAEAIFIALTLIFQVSSNLIQKILIFKTYKIFCQFFKKQVIVKRDNQWQFKEANFIVPGDIIKLVKGDQVPAEVKIYQAFNFKVDESFLTGENLPIEKKVNDVVLAGSFIVEGEAEGIVFATGQNTFWGRSKQLIYPNFQNELFLEIWGLNKKFLKGLLIFLIPPTILGLIHQTFSAVFIWLTSLAVIFLFNGFSLAISLLIFLKTFKFYRLNLLVKNIKALENIGKIDTFLIPKRKILTEDKLTYLKLIASCKVQEKEIINLVLNLLPLQSLFYQPLWKKIEKIVYLPVENKFSQNSDFSWAILRKDKEKIFFFIGSPSKLMEFKFKNKRRLQKIYAQLIQSNLNEILAFGFKKGQKFNFSNLDGGGFLVFSDNLKNDANLILNNFKNLGIDIFLLTNDEKKTIEEFARQINLGNKILDLSSESLNNWQSDIKIINRAQAEDKVIILNQLQKERKVLMIGHDLNDIEAIKKSDVSLALNSAPDNLKKFSDLILIQDDPWSIFKALIEGRKILIILRKLAISIYSSVMDLPLIFFISYLWRLPQPLYPSQILFLNIFFNIFFPLIFIFSSEFSTRPTRKIFSQTFKKSLLVVSLIFLLTKLTIYFLNYRNFYLPTIYFVFSLLTFYVVLFNFFQFKKLHNRQDYFRIIFLSIIWLFILVLIFKVNFLKELLYFDFLPFGQFCFIFVILILEAILVKVLINLKLVNIFD